MGYMCFVVKSQIGENLWNLWFLKNETGYVKTIPKTEHKKRKGSPMKKKGFTLVEILIVVVILGILAAIVIPQFSDASTQSKVSSSKSSLQTLRSQISLYKIQHNDIAPLLADFETQMTQKTNAAGTTNAGDGPLLFGQYMQAIPKNPFNNSVTLAAADAAGVGWVYDEATGDIRLGGAGGTDMNGDGDNTDADEVHLNW